MTSYIRHILQYVLQARLGRAALERLGLVRGRLPADEENHLERRRNRAVLVSVEFCCQLRLQGQSYESPLTLVDGTGREKDVTRDVRAAAEDGVGLAHVAQVGHQLPHAGVVDRDLIRINGRQGEAGAVQERRGVSRTCVSVQHHVGNSLIMGETRLAMPPRRSCSAS